MLLVDTYVTAFCGRQSRYTKAVAFTAVGKSLAASAEVLEAVAAAATVHELQEAAEAVMCHFQVGCYIAHLIQVPASSVFR